MLVLTRRCGERICINNLDKSEQVYIEVMKMDRGQVRLGISAPPNILINREEIQKKIDGDKDAA